MEIEADRFQNLVYTEDVFRTEALAVKGEYLKNISNPILMMLERISDLMFEAHTYKHTTMGLLEDIEAMPDQIEYSHTFFDRWYRPEHTAVIVTNRFTTARYADIIHVLEGGRIVESGSHDELIANDGYYAQTYRLQEITHAP